ncbi:50S ribosomal protein L3 [Candidatus Saccharibacteria bacterium]|nr:50S ribosomal protein L3 [Candidatus Saccharibacteria bacterium]MCB9821557.1 50S ribosomal protein L3 [Candidatus Nomurabacteria bacterium]
MKAIFGTKLGMTSIVDDNGSMVAVTLLSASPNKVVQVKTTEKDGYQAIQLGFGKAKNTGKAAAGHYKKAGIEPVAKLKEVRVDELPEDLKVGDEVKVDSFAVGDIVDVTGTSKGKGWAGTIKRHNFHRQRKTHGGKGDTRKVGSIGSMYPQRIFKGKKMAGQYGGTTVTTERLRVALVDTELNVIGVIGAVPGPNKSTVVVREARR